MAKRMNLSEFELLLTRYGLDIAAWPDDVRQNAESLLESNPQARKLWHAESQMQRLLPCLSRQEQLHINQKFDAEYLRQLAQAIMLQHPQEQKRSFARFFQNLRHFSEFSPRQFFAYDFFADKLNISRHFMRSKLAVVKHNMTRPVLGASFGIAASVMILVTGSLPASVAHAPLFSPILPYERIMDVFAANDPLSDAEYLANLALFAPLLGDGANLTLLELDY